ncbi:MAG: MarR family winged helix-turn-helix transcriptional regulator [Acetobacteraceae bacterium]
MSKPAANRNGKTSRQAPDLLPYAVTLEVRDRCLCLSLQRAARLAGRRFDAALRPFGLTNRQFSLLMALNRPEPPGLGSLAELLAMDHATLTANLKPLERRRLLQSLPDPADARRRRLRLTEAGRRLLLAALPAWRSSEEAVEQAVGIAEAPSLKALLSRLS